jgi:hypothetical protein
VSWQGGRWNRRLPQTNGAIDASRSKSLSISEHGGISDRTNMSRDTSENRAIVKVDEPSVSICSAR